MSYLNLDTSKTKDTVRELNVLLADYHLYYQKLRNFHWNIIGQNFFDLHIQFEDMYNDAKVKIDEIAERILTLRFQPESNFTDYLKISNLKEASSDIEDFKMIKILLKDHGEIISQMRKVVEIADKNGDEGTIDLVGAYIRELEKTSWMLDAWIMKTEEKQHS
ncbi:DNA starvation/stationary phase protection protein [Psychroflexus sp. CAK57W]|uniref:Dps family protein n=1 Tax=Psychroflexus curvus TaxID=2873595 RepID=UPI001CCC283F|nr:DNA starvation/stationary phase protection protein [Psychroflexus curvus]MBZ9786664.1 DNA starvation/stationary phase protection protein [Psychroflexus curvus]